jgi:hypothetical protein
MRLQFSFLLLGSSYGQNIVRPVASYGNGTWYVLCAAYLVTVPLNQSVTVAEQSKVCTVFSRSETGIMGSNPTQGMDVWYVFVLSCV